MFPLLQLGPYAVQVPGLILIVSLWLSLNVAEKEAKRQQFRPELIYSLVFYAVVTGIVGARLWYVGRYLDTYLDSPLEIVALNTNTLAPVAGIGIALLTMILYAQWKRLPLRSTLDILAPGLAFFAVGLSLANLASGDAFGAVTRLPWAIYLWDENRHPSQAYEILLSVAIFILLWRYRKLSPFPGFIFLAWLSLAASARIFLEAFRGDSVIVAGGIRQAQLAGLVVLLLALWLMRQWWPEAEPSLANESSSYADYEMQEHTSVYDHEPDAFYTKH
ncbi:MAG TPA: prolipoprotein diacylglyceryl transferase family protein [candidate division Zixibacteria bacterium]|nr:prolipoprotein diacylglyceryl transferase family protein [candidate division Zixibacteria bacterium]